MNATVDPKHSESRLSETAPTLRFLRELFPHSATTNVGFKLWDGTRWPDLEERAATIVLNHAGAVQEMFGLGTEKGLAEAFIADHFDIEGSVEAACELADALEDGGEGDWWLTAKRLFHLRRASVAAHPRTWTRQGTFASRRHSRARDRRAIAFHYDISNDFFGLWLDLRMQYSCAYFEDGARSLEMAQTAKLHYICRKLRLRPGMRLLDIGCGWGGLAIHAAREYGVQVIGVTLSEAQAELASQRVAHAGLSSQVQIRLADYRDLDPREPFDAITSIGMAEHLGAENLTGYFAKTFEILNPGGTFLNHAIGEGVRASATRGRTFMQDYVFPDTDLQRIPAVLSAAEAAGFEIRDVENLREHYALTLRHWVHRLEETHDAALKFVDEATYRIWRLYLAGSAHGFERGRLAIYQTLLSKADALGDAHLPLARRDWYDER
ncbi:MAG: cyclopropane-fatty-acyl-phospholipid synthase family protein [Opitutus sp.]